MRIFSIAPRASVFVYSAPVNMSLGFPGLMKLVEKELKKKPLSGDLFLFVNKKRSYLKILFWAHAGWNIFAKKLPSGDFRELSGEKLSIAEINSFVESITLDTRITKRTLKKAA